MTKNGNNPVRIRDVADALGLSTATISNVIHNKTAKISAATVERVQKALDEFGYTPNMAAISLAQSYAPIVGVLVYATQRYQQGMLTDPFISRTLDSVASELEARGYFMMLRRESDIMNVQKYARMWNWAGAIFMGFPQPAYRKLEGHMPVPYAIVDGGIAGNEHYSSVRLDNYTAGKQAGLYLAERGHSKVAFLSDGMSTQEGDESSTIMLRYSGLSDALKEYSENIATPKVITVPGGEDERIARYEQIRQEALKGELTAVFCGADIFAVELVNYLTDMGMDLPRQLSIIGFDDIESATRVRPRLTTFRQDLSNRGRQVTKLLLNMVENNAPAVHETQDVDMIERESVAIIE